MSDISSVEVTGIHNRVIAATTPNDKDFYQWNARTQQWEPHQSSFMQEDFAIKPNFNGDPWYGGSLSVIVSSESNHPGVLRLRSASGGSYITMSSLLSDGVPVANAYEITCIIKTPSSFPADALLLIGNIDGIGSTGIFTGFRYDNSQDSQWMSVTGSLSGTHTTNSVAPISTNIWYKLKIRFDGTNYYFSVNDGLEQQHTTNLPGVAMNWFEFYVKSATNFDSYIDYYGLTFTTLSR